MFNRLSKKILLSNLVLTSIVLLGAFLAVFFYAYWGIRYENRKALLNLPGLFRFGSVIEIASQDCVSRYQTSTNSVRQTFFVLTVDSQGLARNCCEIPDCDALDEEYQVLVQKVLKNRSVDRLLKFGESRLQANITESEEKSGDLEIYFLDVTSQYESLSRLLLSFLWIAPLALIPIFFISLYIARRTTKPIREAWERERRFVADASHELKTPLAIIAANTDAIMIGGDKENKEWVGYIKDEINRMNHLVSSLLALAKADDNIVGSKTSARFDLSRSLDETITLYEAIVFERQIDLRQDIESGIIITNDENSIRSVISALFDNAVKYTNPSGFISVGLYQKKGAVELMIENSGEGILPVDLPHIFERFYRADKARENEDSSFGLGLSIVKSLLERIGGEIEVQSVPGQSTVFTIRIKNI